MMSLGTLSRREPCSNRCANVRARPADSSLFMSAPTTMRAGYRLSYSALPSAEIRGRTVFFEPVFPAHGGGIPHRHGRFYYKTRAPLQGQCRLDNIFHRRSVEGVRLRVVVGRRCNHDKVGVFIVLVRARNGAQVQLCAREVFLRLSIRYRRPALIEEPDSLPEISTATTSLCCASKIAMESPTYPIPATTIFIDHPSFF